MLWPILFLFVAYKLVTWGLSRLRVGHYSQKYVFITGCDTGFGNLLAKRLDNLGFHVFAGCLTSAGAEKLKNSCSDRVTTLLLDVTDEKSIKAARSVVESKLPENRGLWGLVNNAGIAGPTAPMEWLTNDHWMKCLSINLFGVISVTQAFLHLVRQERGRVVNMASTMGRIALAPGPYCVSKYGVEAFSDCLRREVYDQGIKVCILEPGFFKTDIINPNNFIDNFRKLYDATTQEVRQHYPQHTIESFSRLTQSVLTKCSDNIHWVVDAYEVALTSRFPPIRQQIGYDVLFFYRLLWNLPTALTDWIIAVAIDKF